MTYVGLVGTPGLVIVTNLYGHAFSESQFSFVFAVLSFSDSVRILATFYSDLSAVDYDGTTGTFSASADSGTTITQPICGTTDCFYSSSVYGDGSAVNITRTAYSGSAWTTFCVNISTIDGNISARILLSVGTDS